jgi:hypothetical protein
MRFSQVPLFWHGLGSHSSISISQLYPVNPANGIETLNAHRTDSNMIAILYSVRISIK